MSQSNKPKSKLQQEAERVDFIRKIVADHPEKTVQLLQYWIKPSDPNKLH